MTYAIVKRINDHGDIYHGIFVWCPGCEVTDFDGFKHGGLNLLPVSGNKKKRPTWTWNKDLVNVTLSPSILTKMGKGRKSYRCHSYLQNGVWRFLKDSTHALAGQEVPMVLLPEWVYKE